MGSLRYRVLLTCGCRVKLKFSVGAKAKLACGAGLGHGFYLNWVEVEDLVAGIVVQNENMLTRDEEAK
jgi:NAD dependent epimerase/dehydratase family enzyme